MKKILFCLIMLCAGYANTQTYFDYWDYYGGKDQNPYINWENAIDYGYSDGYYYYIYPNLQCDPHINYIDPRVYSPKPDVYYPQRYDTQQDYFTQYLIFNGVRYLLRFLLPQGYSYHNHYQNGNNGYFDFYDNNRNLYRRSYQFDPYTRMIITP